MACQCNTVEFMPLFNDNLLKKESYLDKNIDSNLLRVANLHVERAIIMKIIGKCLYNRLVELICTEEIYAPQNECYLMLLKDYIFPVVSYSIQAELVAPTTLKNTNSGLIQRTDNEHYRGASASEMRFQTDYFRSRADEYILQLKEFLKCGECDFAELKGCGKGCLCGSPIVTGTVSSINPIYTGAAAKNRTFRYGL